MDVISSKGLAKVVGEDRKEKAIELYTKGKLSGEGAARYAQMYLGDFIELLREKGIASNITLEDFEESLKNAR